MKMKKKQWTKGKFTLLVIRNADQSVKQINAPKLLILLLILVLLFSIVSITISIILLSSNNQKLLKEKESIRLTLEDKDGSIQKRDKNIQDLQNEVISLTSRTKEMKDRMEKISELEKQLQNLISLYSNKTNTVTTKSISNEAQSTPTTTYKDGSGGEFIELNETQTLQMAQDTNQTLAQMKQDLEKLDSQVSDTLKKAEETQRLIAVTPNLWPTISTRITSEYGYRKDPIHGRSAFHTGLDIGGEYRDPVYAAGDGKVIDTGRNRTDGYYVLIQHTSGLKSKYMHLSSIIVKEKSSVKKGDRIGRMGSTGRSTGTHLHFEIWVNNKQINPLPYIINSRYK